MECPQCNRLTNGSTNRLVRDSCGHTKCRSCLLSDDTQCKLCIGVSDTISNGLNGISGENDGENVILECDTSRVCLLNNEEKTEKESVIKYEESVIKFDSSQKNDDNKKKICFSDETQMEYEIEMGNEIRDESQRKSEIQNESQTKSEIQVKIGTQIKNEMQMKDETQRRPYDSIEIPKHVSILPDQSFQCNVCKKKFTTKSHTKYHLFCVGGKKPFQCDKCNKEFINKSHYDVHLTSHAGLKPHVCDICQKSFIQKSKLTRHKLLHSGAKPFVCQDCGKQFRSRESLKSHGIIHQGEKPFTCGKCSARFNNSSNLKKHLVSHSKEKEHMCDQCGKRFKLKWSLKIHRKSHAPNREHFCKHCSKAFVNSKDLIRHELIHSETKGYSCGVCLTPFRRKDNLERHMRNTHPGKKTPAIKNGPKALVKTIVENPNAVNVIMASPSRSVKPDVKSPAKENNVINPPLKLAFKTSTFKNSYNIHRDPEPNPKPTDPVSIYQMILSPHSPPKVPATPVTEKESTEICKKMLNPFPKPTLHYETSFEHKTHAIIKNIKFKLPSNYTNLKNCKIKDVTPLIAYATEYNIQNDLENKKTYAELKPVTSSSVIVNGPLNEMHWRRRTSETLSKQCKNDF